MERLNVREVDETMDFLKSYVSRAPVAHTPLRAAAVARPLLQPSSPSSLDYKSFMSSHGDMAPFPVSLGNAVAASSTTFSSPTQSHPLTTAAAEQKFQFMAVLSFLRKRYLPAQILDTVAPFHSDNFSNSMGSLSDVEVSTMLDAFCREARGVLHKEKTWQTQLRDGTSRRVNFPPADLLHQSVSHPKSPPPSPRSTATNEKRSKDATSDDDDEDVGTPAKPTRSKKRALKEGMKMMRVGESVVKFSTSGKPLRRCLRVEDRKTRGSSGDTVTVPHLCWSDSASSEPSGQLSLLTIHAIQHKLLSGVVQRDRTGVIRDDVGEAVSAECCASLSFERRGSLDLLFRSPEVAKKWCDALQLVIEKNAKLKSKGDLD